MAPKHKILKLASLSCPGFFAKKEGGRYGAGLLQNVAVMTRGELAGWDLWVDHISLQQALALAKGQAEGVPSHFMHSGDGDNLGSKAGRLTDFRLDGDVLRADLHFYSAAKQSPVVSSDYILSLAEDDPGAFGLSAIVGLDLAAMDNAARTDPQNVRGLPAIRLTDLEAVDLVGDPASNPDGLFSAHDAHNKTLQIRTRLLLAGV